MSRALAVAGQYVATVAAGLLGAAVGFAAGAAVGLGWLAVGVPAGLWFIGAGLLALPRRWRSS